MSDRKCTIDPSRVLVADAPKLVAHHLMLAATYYEACENNTVLITELGKVLGDGLSLPAALAWLRALDEAYEQIEEPMADERED